MRKSFIFGFLILLFYFCSPALADDFDNYSDLDDVWSEQKTITNKEYEDVVNALQDRKNIGEKKKRKKKIKKIIGGGQTLHKELDSEKELNEIPVLKKDEDGVLVNIPVELILDQKILERGYYNVVGVKQDGKAIIKFYQSQFLKGEIIAEETTDDFEEKDINFAKILDFNENFVKLIFGSIDFNAYVYIPFRN